MNRRVVLFGAAGAAGVLVLWFLLLWSPRQSAIAEQKKRATAAQQSVADLQTHLRRLQDLKRDEPLRRSQLETLRAAIPDQPNLAQFILDANDAADTAGIQFLSITPSPPTSGTGPDAPGQIGLSLSISGGYFQVLDYLNRLDDLPRILVIDGLTLTPGGVSGATGGAAAPAAGPKAGDLTVAITGKMFVDSTAVQGAAPATGASTTTSTTAPATSATNSTGNTTNPASASPAPPVSTAPTATPAAPAATGAP